jgi:predicted molibdopterin-dependent oxidoreductase YjgC
VIPHWRLLRDVANHLGMSLSFQSAEDVFSDLAAHDASFRGLSYEVLEEHNGAVLATGAGSARSVDLMPQR